MEVLIMSRGSKELECAEPKRLTGGGLIMYGTRKRDKGVSEDRYSSGDALKAS